jgi:hypothetical protein
VRKVSARQGAIRKKAEGFRRTERVSEREKTQRRPNWPPLKKSVWAG